MPDDSTDGGTDNPAFSHDEDTSSADRGSESAVCNSSGDEKTASENGNQSFASKHCVEPRKGPESQFKTETRIEVPDESTTTQEKPQQNGHHGNGNGNNNDVSFLNATVTSVSNNDANDKKEQIEAVNLELVSMKPYSGSGNHQAKNQEACEVPADPYEEYFVPVNEHRKYMRGEKLYVTKDKRSTKSYWRKIICWGCGFLILALIAIVAILAGTGVILTQEDTQPLLDSGKTSSRQFNNAQPVGSQDYIKNPPSSPPPATSTFPPWPTTDESLYRHVPKALDGLIKLDDLDWNGDINDPKSRVYRMVVDDLEKNLVKMLSLNDVMPIVKVHSISKDGEVKFRVSQPVFEKPEDNQNHLEDKFRQNGSAIGRYHVNRLQINSLVNDCYSGSMGCMDSCVYDYLETIFICMCPTGKSFDSDAKKCVDNLELSHVHFEETESGDVQGRSRIPDDIYNSEPHGWKDSNYDLNDHYHHEHTSPEPKSEPEPNSEKHHYHHEETSPEPKSEPEPSSEEQHDHQEHTSPEPKSKPEPSSGEQYEHHEHAVSEPKSEPEPTSGEQYEHHEHTASEPNSEPEPTSGEQRDHHEYTSLEPKSEPEPSSGDQHDHHPYAPSEPKSEPEPSSGEQHNNHEYTSPEPKSEPEPSSGKRHDHHAYTSPEPKSEPEPSSGEQHDHLEHTSPEPSSGEQYDHHEHSSPEPNIEPEPSSGEQHDHREHTSPEPKSEPEPSSFEQHDHREHTSPDPKSEPEPSSVQQRDHHEHTSPEPKSEPEPSSGEKHEHTLPEPKSEPEPEFEPTAEVKPSSDPQSAAEPTPEPEPSTDDNNETEKIITIDEDVGNKGSTPGLETTKMPSNIPVVIGLNEVTTQTNIANQSITEKSLNTSDGVQNSEELGKELVKTVPRLDKEERNSPNPSDVKGVVNASDNNEETNDSKIEVNDAFVHVEEAPPTLKNETQNADKPTLSNREIEKNKEIDENLGNKVPFPELKPLREPEAESATEVKPFHDPQSAAEATLKPETSADENNKTEKNIKIDEELGNKGSTSGETTNMPSDIPDVIGFNEVTTPLNSESQSVTFNTNDGAETGDILGKEPVKKGPRLDKGEQDFLNPVEVHFKDVMNASYYNEQKNDTNTGAKDSFKHNVNSSSNIEHSKNQVSKDIGEKNEVSPEEQYNDITDDIVPKGFGKNDIEISNEERKIQKIYKENKNINYTKSKVDSELADKLNFKPTTSPITDVTDKRVEDPNMTSQVPILPIEIQLEMSSTESTEKVNPQTTAQEAEKDIIATSLPNITSTEGKTTEQIPILPEELQTTMINKQEHRTESTLSIDMDKKSDGLDHKKEVKEQILSDSNENSSSTELTILKEIAGEDFVEKTTVYNLPSESSVEDIVKPVFESISDDTTPQTFEYKYLLTTTTEKPEISNDFEDMTDEQLLVIPLEGSHSSPTPKTDESTKMKKEKELSLNTSADDKKGNNVDRKSSRTVDDDNIPKLTQGSASDVNPDEGLKTIFISPDFKPQAATPFKEKKINFTDHVKYPNFIPVSEEIDENDYHFTESTHFPSNSQHDIATDLPELHSKEMKNNVYNREVEREDNETTTELLQAVESSTNKTLLVENLLTINESNDKRNVTAIERTTEENKTVTSSSSEPPQSEFLEIPVAIMTSEQGIPQQVFFTKCKSGQFQCVNGTSRDGSYCVDLSSTCDSENDCSDGSDEFDCEKEGCPGNFQCASGQCLKRHLVCNGIADCDDGSDEKECSNWKCHFDEFQCPNGRCIPVLWQCDGRPDCENHADEYSCSESCGNDEYLCPTEKWCIPQTWRCNGMPECVNGEDEKLCECAVDQFKCETGGCIPADQLCDGVENCPDRSDEWNCLSGFGKNSSNATDVDKENKENEFSTKSSPVMIRQSNGEQRYVCSDGWTDAFSDHYCTSLGFAASESTQFMDVGAEKRLLQLLANANPNSSIVLNLEKVDTCNSEKIVEVSCQEFSCGSHESVGPTARLVGGTPATEGQWSSVALLKEPKYGTSCTASIVSPMHALASYSCIYSNRQSAGWQMFVGGNLLKPNKVKNIVPYPQVKYNQFLYNNDIALVELVEALVFSRNVSAACLPNQTFQPPQLCVTVGWGFPVNGEVDLQQYLKFLPVPTYNSEECNATSHYAGFITKNNICAGFTDNEKGPCYNDEGAPLMCVSETGRWEIQGLLSHHSRCSRGHPAIYSSLAPALSWLRNSVPALQTHS